MRFFGILATVVALAISGVVSAEDNKQPDVRIVIDISGSMKDTDPENLRRPALNLLTELLPDGARAGVWTFGRYVNMLVPLETVDAQWRAKAKKAAGDINSVGLNTNLVGALDKALWQATADSSFDQTVILLTDGRIDMDGSQGNPGSPPNAAERQRLMKEILPRYTGAGVRIHTLALSDAADETMLQQIAMETDGLFLKAHTADELMPAFLKAFDRAVPAEQVPMENNRFSIDPSVKEFTALIFRKSSATPTVLISPSGERIGQEVSVDNENVRWHHDLNFDLVTIKNPEQGEWSAEADLDPENRVQILSDLKLSVKGLPGSLFSGVPVELEMALVNEGETVNEPTILQLTDVSLQVTAPDGRTGSKLLSDPESLPVDGVFREVLSRLTQPGEYRLEVNAIGRTFQRRQVLTATLAEPLRVESEADADTQTFSVRVYSDSDMVDTTLSRVIARVTSPDGSSVINSMEFDTADNAWKLDLQGEKGDGQYEVMLNIRGVSGSGMTFKSKPETMVVEFPIPAAGGDTQIDTPAVAGESHEALQPVSEPAEESVEEVPVPPEPVAPPPPSSEPIAPDLAEKYADESTELPEEEEEGIPWWVYAILVVANLGLIGGLAWWWLSRRKAAGGDAEDASKPEPVATSVPDLNVGPLDDADLDEGDFDDFADEAEEEIPAASDEEDSRVPASMGGDTMMPSAQEDDFDLGDEAADDEWGEFDLPDEEDKK